MGVLDEAAQLLAESESIEKNRQAGMLLGKAVLLQAATEACVDSVSTRDWEHARHKLACVLIDVVNMIADLPGSGKD